MVKECVDRAFEIPSPSGSLNLEMQMSSACGSLAPQASRRRASAAAWMSRSQGEPCKSHLDSSGQNAVFGLLPRFATAVATARPKP